MCFLMTSSPHISFFFFFNDTATTEIYTLSLHDALPISSSLVFIPPQIAARRNRSKRPVLVKHRAGERTLERSEEHTSELQSLAYLVCRLLLEKKKKKKIDDILEKHTLKRIRKTARDRCI